MLKDFPGGAETFRNGNGGNFLGGEEDEELGGKAA